MTTVARTRQLNQTAVDLRKRLLDSREGYGQCTSDCRRGAELSSLKHSKFCILRFMCLAFGLCMPGCSPALLMTKEDISDVIEQVIFTEEKINPNFCVRKELKERKVVFSGQRGWDGWIRSDIDSDVKFRELSSEEMPALSAKFIRQHSMRNKNCERHTLVFSKPDFIQVQRGVKIFIVASVDFHNDCAECGYGRFVSFRKTTTGWVIEPPGIRTTWVA